MLRRKVVLEPGKHGKYYVDGFIDGRGPISFLVDTGASSTVITDEIADAIGLEWRSGHKVETRGIIGKGDSWQFRAQSIRIGDIEVKDLGLTTLFGVVSFLQ